MKNSILLIIIMITIFVCNKNKSQDLSQLKDGDIIFHTSQSKQSKMIEEVTDSKLTHVGVIFFKDNKPYVIEAVSPVKITPIKSFISRGLNSDYKVMRPNFELTNKDKETMYSYAKSQLNKSYDLKFQWSDNKMYCSELVWKIYKNAGVELCETKTFSDYDMDGDLAKSAIKNRYKNSSIDFSEKVVTPSDLSESDKLVTIIDTY